MNVFFRLAVGPVLVLGSWVIVADATAAAPVPVVAPAAPRDRIGCLGRGGFIEGCRGQYGRERTALKNEMDSLRAQAAAAQGVLDTNLWMLSRYTEILSTERTTAANLSREIPEKEKIIAVLDETLGDKFDQALKELESFSAFSLESSGKALLSLRDYLGGSLAGVTSRLAEIDTELLASDLSVVDRDALRFERRVLVRIQAAASRNLKPGEFEEIVKKIRTSTLSAEAGKLPPDLISLIAAVVQSETRQLKEREVSSLLQSRMNWVKLKFSSLRDELKRALEVSREYRAGLVENIVKNQSGYEEWKTYLDDQRAIRDRANSRYLSLESRHEETAILLECCDDHPYCRANRDGWEDYENRVRNRGNDNCR